MVKELSKEVIKEVNKQYPKEVPMEITVTGQKIKVALPKALTMSMGWHKDAKSKKLLEVYPIIQDNAIVLVNKNSKLTEDEFLARTEEYFYKNDPDKRQYALKRWFSQMPFSTLEDPSGKTFARLSKGKSERAVKRTAPKGFKFTLFDRNNKLFALENKSKEAQAILKKEGRTAKEWVENDIKALEKDKEQIDKELANKRSLLNEMKKKNMEV